MADRFDIEFHNSAAAATASL